MTPKPKFDPLVALDTWLTLGAILARLGLRPDVAAEQTRIMQALGAGLRHSLKGDDPWSTIPPASM